MKSEQGRTMTDFMKLAVEEAKLGLREGGIPIGSVLVKDGRVIARGHNKRVQENDPILHAIVQFAIMKVIAGESENFSGARKFMEEHGIEVIDLNVDECKKLMRAFIQSNLRLWKEDIGEL